MLRDLSTQIFADGADLEGIISSARDPIIRGFTTNPSLMWKAGLTDYRKFADRLLEEIPDRPISFEVVSDDPQAIRDEARLISEWGPNVFAKVPVTTTEGRSLGPQIRDLTQDGVHLNVTALLTVGQVEAVAGALENGASSYVSVFAGRIADTGIDPVPIMREAVQVLELSDANAELIWASPREVLNIVQADSVGCHVITMTPQLLAKLDCLGKDLEQFSLETVQMFHRDGAAAGLAL